MISFFRFWICGVVVSVIQLLAFVFVAQAAEPVVLLDEDFREFRSGLWQGVVNAHPEYHYLPEVAPHGKWSVSTYHSGIQSQRAWRVMSHDGRRVLAQTFDNRKERHTHPMVVAGDPLWTDYRLVVRFASVSSTGRSGVVFRYQNDRCYYFLGVEGAKVSLRLVRHETAFHQPYEKTLAESKFTANNGDFIDAVVSVQGNRIEASLDGKIKLSATDDTYPAGRVGLVADVPTMYEHVLVTTSAAVADTHGGGHRRARADRIATPSRPSQTEAVEEDQYREFRRGSQSTVRRFGWRRRARHLDRPGRAPRSQGSQQRIELPDGRDAGWKSVVANRRAGRMEAAPDQRRGVSNSRPGWRRAAGSGLCDAPGTGHRQAGDRQNETQNPHPGDAGHRPRRFIAAFRDPGRRALLLATCAALAARPTSC